MVVLAGMAGVVVGLLVFGFCSGLAQAFGMDRKGGLAHMVLSLGSWILAVALSFQAGRAVFRWIM